MVSLLVGNFVEFAKSTPTNIYSGGVICLLTDFKNNDFHLGRRITRTIIDMGGYNSISGNYIHIDKNGDSQVIGITKRCYVLPY